MNPAMAAQYQQYQHQQHQQQQRMSRGPHPGTQGRRGIPGMIPTPQQVVQQSRVPQQVLRESHDPSAEKYKSEARHASTPQERNLPEGLEDIVIGNGVEEFKRLRAMERKLDAIMIRKRLEFQDQKQKIKPRTRKLRVWITNTAENQPWQGKDLDPNAFDFNSGTESTFKVTIVGKLVDEDTDSKPATSKEAADSVEAEKSDLTPPKPRFSDLFKSVSVELDRSRSIQPDGSNAIEWKKQPPSQRGSVPAEFDCLQFERKGDENINCTINLLRDEQPERFAMAKQLQDLVCEEEATKEMIVNAFWLYVRKMGLQRDEDKRTVRLDDTLKAIFGDYEYVQFPQIWELITPHLKAVQPIKLPYTIRVDPEYQANPTPTVYDVMIAGPDPVHEQIRTIIQYPAFQDDLSKIQEKDKEITDLVQAINISKSRHSFFNSMAKDPVTFLRRWTSSQKRDLEIILGDSRVGSGTEWVSDEFRRGGQESIWTSDNAKEAAELLVSRPGRWGK